MTPDSRPVEESREAMNDLVRLVEELTVHTKRLRTEIASLSFMTQVQAVQTNGDAGMLEKLGGEAGAKVAVNMLYERVMGDPELAPYFSGANMMRVRKRQLEMFLALLGVRDYTGTSLRVVHAPLSITDSHFVRMIDYLGEVLAFLGLSKAEVELFVGKVLPYREEIVSDERE